MHAALLHHVRFDDAYITFRYGMNLVLGRGLVFNPGDRLMGSTSPGACLLSAVAYAIVGKDRLPDVMAALGCAAWVGQGAVLFLLLRAPIGRACAAFVGLAVALGVANSAPWIALETHIAVLFALSALWLAIDRRHMLAAVAAAAATMMRPDAALLLAPLGALALLDRRARAWQPLALYAVLLLPWLLFATWYYGTPIPQSAVRKAGYTGLAAYAEHVAVVLGFPHGLPPGWRLLAAPFVVIGVMGGARVVRKDRRYAAFVSYPALHVAAYLVLRPNVIFVWHLYPATVTFTALVLVELVATRWRVPGRAMAAALVAYAVVQDGVFAFVDSRTGAYGGREAVYRAISAHLRAHAHPSDMVGCEEVGTIGYIADLTMNDHAGLVTRDPMIAYAELLSRAPSHLRWMVLNPEDRAQTEFIYGPRTLLPFESGDTIRWLVDLTERPHVK